MGPTDACGVDRLLVTAVDESGEGPAGNATGGPRVLNSTGDCAQGCVPAGGSCVVTDECCGGRCVSDACAPACCARKGELCASDAECCNGACCDGLCVDPSTNAGNCGGCGLACSTNHVPSPACVAGICVGLCEVGWGDCDGNKQTDGCETNTLNDPNNCGTCGIACSPNHVPVRTCTAGVCTGACEPGWGDCDGNNQTDGCETSLLSDPAHCGSCPNACPPVPNATVICAGGACAFTCNGQDNDCDGAADNGCETDISTDALNCGGCGLACSTNHVPVRTCGGGICTGACAPGWGDCNVNKLWDGCEADIASNPDNCGECGLACSTNHVQVRACTGGVCTGACEPAWGNCDGIMRTNGCETNLNTDPDNCGSCGRTCGTIHVCIMGQCQ